MLFQRSSAATLAASQSDVAALNYAAETGHDVLHRHFMAFGDGTGGSVLYDQQLVTVFVRLPRRRFHADLRRYAAQHDGPDMASAQLQIELGAVERAPLSLGNPQVTWLH